MGLGMFLIIALYVRSRNLVEFVEGCDRTPGICRKNFLSQVKRLLIV